MEVIIFACLLAAVIGLLSFFIGRHLYPQQRDADRATLLAAQSEIERLTAGLSEAKAELQSASEEARAKSDAFAALEKSNARLEERALVQDRQVVGLSDAVAQARAAREQAENASRAESEQVVRLLEREESSKKQIVSLESTCNRLSDESSKLGSQCKSVAEEVARLTERCQAHCTVIVLGQGRLNGAPFAP
jgi:chromosome segregation ATPase